MMLSGEALDEVAAILTGPMFESPRHELIFEAALETAQHGAVDAITVTDRLRSVGELERAGGAAYLHQIVSSTPTAASAAHYAGIVRRDYQRNAALTALTAAMQSLTRGDDVQAALGSVQASMDGLMRGATNDGPVNLVDHIEATTDRLSSGTHGATTGLRDWDEATGGIAPGELWIIGARPGMGKTVVGLEIARANARAGRPVLFFTFEMSPEQMMTRVFAAECSIPTDRMSLTKPGLTKGDWDKITETMPPLLNSWDFYLDAGSASSVETVLGKVRAYQRRHPDLVVVIDYLQLMTSTRTHNSRTEEIGTITRQIKLAALNLQVPVVLLSQLNRASESRPDKRPAMSDLKESGSSEQDADGVALLHREDVYDKESPRAGEMDVILAKNRSGPTRTVSVAAQLHYMRVRDMARDLTSNDSGEGF